MVINFFHDYYPDQSRSSPKKMIFYFLIGNNILV